MPPLVLPAYAKVVQALTPVVKERTGIIVTIDGRDGVGKTTLGRYLAWHFNVTLIETDLFIIPAQDHFIHLDDQINRIIERRIATQLPVIVEGISMLQLMKRLNRAPDFSVYVTNRWVLGSKLLQERLSAYEAAFAPYATADIIAEIQY